MKIENIFPIWKPKGPTSNQVLERLRKITGIKKIGHAGTLDPLASGVLIVGIGKATKMLSQFQKKEKEYLADIKLGMESSTDDEEGTKRKIFVSKPPSLREIEKILKTFQGEILQTPPIFSAVKVGGKEAYKWARRGKIPKLKPRRVQIKKIEILNYQWPILSLKIITGPGVYIRSLARDLGKKLKTGGYLKNLERTRVGEFSKEKALTISQFERLITKASKP